MGFISTGETINLEAYLTQLGRNYLLTGSSSKSKIKYFTLGDSDINYIISSNENGNAEKNIPSAGFIPNVTGDDNGCIRSVADGVNIKSRLKHINPIVTTVTNGVTAVTVTTSTGSTTTTTSSTGTTSTTTTTTTTEPAYSTVRSLRMFTGSTSVNTNNLGTNTLRATVNLHIMQQWISTYAGDPNITTTNLNPFADFYEGIKLVTYQQDENGAKSLIEGNDIPVNLYPTNIQAFKKLSYMLPYVNGSIKFNPANMTYPSPLQFVFSSRNDIQGIGKAGMIIYPFEYLYTQEVNGDFTEILTSKPLLAKETALSLTTKTYLDFQTNGGLTTESYFNLDINYDYGRYNSLTTLNNDGEEVAKYKFYMGTMADIGLMYGESSDNNLFNYFISTNSGFNGALFENNNEVYTTQLEFNVTPEDNNTQLTDTTTLELVIKYDANYTFTPGDETNFIEYN